MNFLYAIFSDQTGGTFGDTFGAANALFSGTALLMLVLAVSLQREELQQVKEERNDTRKLLEGQEVLNEQQKTALEKQIFEQTFGSLLNSALQEKKRLSFRPVTGDKLQQSEYFNAGMFSARLIREFAKGMDRNALVEKSGTTTLADKNFVYVNMLVQLTKLSRESNSDDGKKVILRALFDEESTYSLTWYTIRLIIFDERSTDFVETFNYLNLHTVLDADAKKGFDLAISELQ